MDLTRLGRQLAALLAVAITAGTLAACGGSPVSSPGKPRDTGTANVVPTRTAPVGPGHNQIDVDFAQMMIVHHRQTLQMTDLASENAGNNALLVLAETLATEQQAEIDALTGLLGEWGEDVPDEISMENMDHSTMDPEGIAMGFMSGMISDADITDLAALDGAAFDAKFLKLMRVHHGGSIAMAYAERFRGENEDAVELAKSIESKQTDEVEEMKTLLRRVQDAAGDTATPPAP